jgi:hypothetical protein
VKRLWCIALVAAAACEDVRAPSSDELTIVVQSDLRELEQQEKSLREREEALRTQKAELDKQIPALLKSLKVAADTQQRSRIEEQLQSSRDLETQLDARQTALQAQKTDVAAKKAAMDANLVTAAQAALAARESGVVAREAKLGDREAQLGSREKEIAAREKAVAAREAAIAAHEPELRPDVPKAPAVEAKHKRLLADLDARGILITDLPPEDQPLNAQVFAARRKGDLAHAWDLVGELTRVVAQLKVDQRFVEQKMVRLQGARTAAKLSDDQRREVERLLREVTSAYSDGHYDQANKVLNRIAAILDAGSAAG